MFVKNRQTLSSHGCAVMREAKKQRNGKHVAPEQIFTDT